MILLNQIQRILFLPPPETKIEETPVAEPVIEEVPVAEPVQVVEQILKEPKPEPPAEIEKIGNKTIERKGDKVTITEVMTPNGPIAQPETGIAQMAGNGLLGQNRSLNLAKAILKRKDKKSKHLESIIRLFSKKPNIQNADVQKLLHIADSTAHRYLDQLEKSNQIRQIGEVGQSVYYEKI